MTKKKQVKPTAMEEVLMQLALGQQKQSDVMEKILEKLDGMDTRKEDIKPSAEEIEQNTKFTIKNSVVWRVCKGQVDPVHGTTSYDPALGKKFKTKQEAIEEGLAMFGKRFNVYSESIPVIER